MADKEFDTSLLRFIGAELFFLLSMQVSREMYGKSYFSLGVVEKTNVDQIVLNTVGGNFEGLTFENLRPNERKPIGFEAPSSGKDKESARE